MNIKIIGFILVLFIPAVLLSQNIAEQKFKLAESYENQGNYEESLRIYKEIYTSNKNNDKYFAGIIRSLRGLSKYSEMLPFLEEKLENKPGPVILILYGEVKWRLGDNKTANKYWGDVLDDFQINDVYLELAQVQINLQLYDKAIRTMKQARDDLQQSNLFTDELSKLYIATGNYKEGLDETINILLNQGDMAKSQGRLFAFLTSDEAIEYIDLKLYEYSEKMSDNLYIQELYSWFLRNTNKLDKALEVTVRIDDLRNSGGRNIVHFANNARDDGQYDIAMKAYSYIIQQGKSNKNTPSALYGFTRTLELKMLNNETIDKESTEEIIKSYYKVIKDYPNSQYAAQAYFRLAELYYKNLNNTDEAVKNIESLREQYASHTIVYDALNLLGEIYLGQHKFDEALEAFEYVSKRASTKIIKDNAKYNIANIEFYKGNIESALEKYNTISTDTGSDAANNALEKILLINDNKELIKGLKLYGEYELAMFANELNDAAGKLQNIINEYPDDNLTKISYIKLGELFFNNEKYEKSIKELEDLINKFPEYINNDYAYFLIGMSYLKIDDFSNAEKYLTKILVEFPESVYMNEARKKIREIRKQV
jgi:tetratricopeptide (TPR) repeat protein